MPTLAEALDSFLKVDRADSTNERYRRILERFIARVGPDQEVQSITLSRLLDYNAWLRPAISQNSLAQYTLVLKSFFSWCDKADLIEKSPARKLHVRMPPRDPSVNRAIPRDHVERMCRYAYPNARDYAIIHFFAATGARVGGVASLQLARLNLAEGEADILEKGEQFVRVDFWGEAVTALGRWLDERPKNLPHDYVFTGNGQHRGLTIAGITEVVRRVSLRACGREYSPHSFRHYVSHTLEDAGEIDYNIQYKLYHKSIRTTKGVYLRNRNPNVKAMTRRNAHLTNPATETPIEPANIIYLDETG